MVLHLADSQHMDDGERLLNCLPLCIFLKCAGETWIVDDDLGHEVCSYNLQREHGFETKIQETKCDEEDFP